MEKSFDYAQDDKRIIKNYDFLIDSCLTDRNSFKFSAGEIPADRKSSLKK